MNKKDQIIAFANAIWEWYGTHKRTLPWRDMDIEDDTERAYRVMVSEIMLQQTQVSRVIIVFRNFLETFPTIQSLADASNAEVIMAWRGMGYNSRALRLRDAARTIITDHGGIFTSDFDQLVAIKGLGPYTAAAIRNFAFNISTPCIDTNIRRILHRTFVGPEMADGRFQMADRELLKIAEEVLTVAVPPPIPQPLSPARRKGSTTKWLSGGPHDDCMYVRSPLPSGEGLGEGEVRRSAADWHAALMDYGSLVQTKSSPKWDQCILTEHRIMKTTPQIFEKMLSLRSLSPKSESLSPKREPGRFVGSRYIPNRIFRGKIVEALRDAQDGLSEEEIGRQICIDWNPELRPWLHELVKKLVTEKMLREDVDRYQLYV